MSAAFESVFQHNIISEGGFANRSKDPGGYTYMGLSRPNHPNFPGWPLVAQWVKKVGGEAKAYRMIFPDPVLTKMVKDYYIKTYWRPLLLDQVQDEFTAIAVYDFVMNSGGGAEQVNIALGLSGKKITPQTIAVINRDPIAANQRIYERRKAYVLSLPARDSRGRLIPGKKLVDYNPGLLKRIEKFATHPRAAQVKRSIQQFMFNYFKLK